MNVASSFSSFLLCGLNTRSNIVTVRASMDGYGNCLAVLAESGRSSFMVHEAKGAREVNVLYIGSE
jgi:hypothetical protein